MQSSVGTNGTSGKCGQVDTNNPNEIVRAAFSSAPRIVSLRLPVVDNDDTLRLDGLGAGGALNLIGYAGTIAANGVLVSGSLSGGNGTYTLNFGSCPSLYSTFYLTSNNNSADGYRINEITTAVPEPATWAMLILGFGIVGTAMRRRVRMQPTRVTA